MGLGACQLADTPPTPLAPDLQAIAPLNGQLLKQRGDRDPFRFIITGHLYGDPAKSSMPADTLRSAASGLSRRDADFMIACGDTFRTATETCFDQTVDALQALQMPVFNAVGNHDVNPRAGYHARFGSTYGAFVHGGCAFILLDSEATAWEIADQQLAFLQRALQTAAGRADIRAVFCFAHKLVFAHQQRYFEVLLGSNALDGLRGPNRFAIDILPALTQVAESKPVFWCGGDVGLAHTLATFYDRDEVSGVQFLATGLGDSARDAVVEVEIADDQVLLALIPLTDRPADRLEDCGVNAWASRISTGGLPKELETFRSLLPK